MVALAIAKTAFLENIRQTVYLVISLVGMALVFLSQYVTMFVLGQETATIIETAFSSVLAAGLLIAIFSSSNLIYSEFESMTLMTVLAKPVRRGQVILGKFLGIFGAILLSTLLLCATVALTAWMSIRTYNDMRFDAVLTNYLLAMSLLTLAQLLVIVALTVLFATMLPLTLTALFTALMFILGNLQDYLLIHFQAHAMLRPLGWLYQVAVPNFGFFNQGQLLYSGIAISKEYVILNTFYAAVYSAVYLVFATMLMSRKDFS